MSHQPNSASKASSWAENCPKAYKETNSDPTIDAGQLINIDIMVIDFSLLWLKQILGNKLTENGRCPMN